MRERFLSWRNRTTIHTQLSIVVGLLLAMLILWLTLYSYLAQQRSNTLAQTESLSRILVLESERLDNYISELASYSLQLRNDNSFMDIIAQDEPLNYNQRQTVESAFKTCFYSRSDIGEMNLYLLRQDLQLHIDDNSRKVIVVNTGPVTALPDYERFIAAPDYISIQPAQHGFLTITRTIIDSPFTTPLAVVRIVVDSDEMDALLASHAAQSESAFLFGSDGTALTTDGREAEVWKAISDGETAVKLDDEPCVLVSCARSDSVLVLAAAKARSVINVPLVRMRNTLLLMGIAALILTVALVLYAIRTLTRPLTTLVQWLQRVGAGNFEGQADLQGSYEMAGLSAEVNRMKSDISELINRTYVASLNERTAQLAALEAQTNPHFLFNTLQAIATEAIVTGNEKIYQMVSALAGLLRYSISEGNLVPLKTEIQYVEKYILLQRARFGERLDFTVSTDETILELPVPKLGLLSLVENSIVHGMKGSSECVHILLECRADGKNLRLTVRDDGGGIGAEQLETIRREINDGNVIVNRNIGLNNLASRIRLLCHGRAQMRIESSVGERHYTAVELLIPIEELQNVQDTDRG